MPKCDSVKESNVWCDFAAVTTKIGANRNRGGGSWSRGKVSKRVWDPRAA